MTTEKIEALGFAEFIRENGIKPSAEDVNIYYWEDSESKKYFNPSELYEIYISID